MHGRNACATREISLSRYPHSCRIDSESPRVPAFKASGATENPVDACTRDVFFRQVRVGKHVALQGTLTGIVRT